MSATAKLLTILLLIMSAAYAAVSASLFAKRQDYKTKLEKLAAEKGAMEADLKGKIEEWQSRSRKIEKEKQAADGKVGQLTTALRREEAGNKRLEAQLASRAKEVERLQTSNETLVSELKAEKGEVRHLRAKADKLDAELVAVREDTKQKARKIEELADAKSQQERDIAGLKESLTETKTALGDREQTLELLTKKGVDIGQASKRIVLGRVIGTRGNVVVINRGRDDGVLIGSDFTIHGESDRGYVGKMRVYQVEKDLAYGSPVKGFVTKPIKIGDQVRNDIQ